MIKIFYVLICTESKIQCVICISGTSQFGPAHFKSFLVNDGYIGK